MQTWTRRGLPGANSSARFRFVSASAYDKSAVICRAELPLQSQQRRFQFQKRAQQFVRLNDVSATIVLVGIDYPAPTIGRDSVAITPGKTGSTQLVAMISQYFMELLPFSSPDEFPTPRSFLACFSGLNDRQEHGQYHKRLCPSP
jgi:hypothetical protein